LKFGDAIFPCVWARFGLPLSLDAQREENYRPDSPSALLLFQVNTTPETLGKQLLRYAHAIGDFGFHSRGTAQCPVHSAKVIVRELQRKRSFQVVLDFPLPRLPQKAKGVVLATARGGPGMESGFSD
jgi:hypothetical protein